MPEEYDLQAFKPIAASFTSLNFKQVNSGQIYDKNELAHLRFYRILMIGEKLSKDPFLLLEKGEGEWRALEREYVQVKRMVPCNDVKIYFRNGYQFKLRLS